MCPRDAQPGTVDYVIVGASFSGALLAWILAKAGRHVLLVDRQTHPRFAIGESSTPLADLQLERIADEFGLDALKPLSRWGSWRKNYPALGVGLKRGFSYYRHQRGRAFSESNQHENSLLAAASESQILADTHWLRSDVDQWFTEQALAAGAHFVQDSQANLLHVTPDADFGCRVRIDHRLASWDLRCRHLVDSSGGRSVLGTELAKRPAPRHLHTRTGALFGHFRNVESMTAWLTSHGQACAGDPFDGDLAAQHHVLEDGWMWMLRFQGGSAAGLTSVGIVRPCERWTEDMSSGDRRSRAWEQLLAQYPSLQDLLHNAELVAPHAPPAASGPASLPTLGWIPRISRYHAPATGSGWSRLPGSVGIIDPLHSTGIAHNLSGVWRVARYLLHGSEIARKQYAAEVLREIEWIDVLVRSAYRALDESFDCFRFACQLYLLAAIHSERELADTGEFRSGFVLAQSPRFTTAVRDFLTALLKVPSGSLSAAELASLRRSLEAELADWDKVGFFHPGHHHRFARTAAPKNSPKKR